MKSTAVYLAACGGRKRGALAIPSVPSPAASMPPPAGRSGCTGTSAARSREQAMTTLQSTDATAHPDHRAADPATNPIAATPPPASGAPSHPWRRGLLWAGGVAGLAFAGYALAPTVKTMVETVSTDDAYVNGHVTYVAPRVAG